MDLEVYDESGRLLWIGEVGPSGPSGPSGSTGAGTGIDGKNG